ncbi:MAG: thioredoxin domain-containing protein [Breznakibacter sp.]
MAHPATHTNRLIHETSPYLLEHAHNPVDWFAWGDEALDKAREENKPLIVSIGYAACHWCHVMEHQSFSDVEVANFMNRHFVCIKIDREERPDLDKIYMDAVQTITGSGGWPLNAFALPDGHPFYGGTYFPKAQWLQLLRQIADVWEVKSHDVALQAEGLTRHIRQADLAPFEAEPPHDLSNIYNRQLLPAWAPLVDLGKGGFNGSPKFVLPVAWEFLLQYYHLHQSPWSLKAVEGTLVKVQQGGIHDHLGGGFARYSVDDNWHVPHFEKMLYDNAQLLSLYAHAFQATGKESFKATALGIVHFLNTGLRHGNGTYLSSVNADSEGVEGKYYVWTLDELRQALPHHLLDVVRYRYNITSHGNWEHGINVLSVASELSQVASLLGIGEEEADLRLRTAHRLLYTRRDKRIKPTIDDKVLTSWNALAIIGMIDLYRATREETLLENALQCAHSICQLAIGDDGHLFHNLKKQTASIDGFLDDYAFLASAFIHLYQVTFDAYWLRQSHKTVVYVMAHFASDESPLFYYTPKNAMLLVARKTEVTDNVTPSSNSVMAEVLLKLGTYYRDDSWVGHSLKMIQTVSGHITKGGPYYGNWNKIMGIWVHGLTEVRISGANPLDVALEMQRNYLPNCLFAGGNPADIPLLAGRTNGASTEILVCANGTCHLPVNTTAEALALLKTPH